MELVYLSTFVYIKNQCFLLSFKMFIYEFYGVYETDLNQINILMKIQTCLRILKILTANQKFKTCQLFLICQKEVEEFGKEISRPT